MATFSIGSDKPKYESGSIGGKDSSERLSSGDDCDGGLPALDV